MNLAMDKKNPKRLFAYVNNKQELNSGIEALTKDGKTTYNKKEIADTLNKQFESAFSHVGQQVHREFASRTKAILADINIPESTIKDLIQASDPHRSQDCDLVHPFVMREAASEFAKPLCRS